MGDGGVDGRGAWWRSSIRDLVLLIVVVEFLAWMVRQWDASGALLKHWPLVAMLSACVLGLVWSIGRIYRAEPSRQTRPIVGLIVSLLGLLATPIVYAIWMDRNFP